MFRALLSAAALALVWTTTASANELPLKRVTLSTSGLAQFEYQGQVSGNQKITLPVRLDQVDDVLKSLVVLDNAGSLGGVSLPGREPLSTIFRDMPFDEAALNSPEILLQSLRGADVSVQSGADTIQGKLVSITAEDATTADSQIIRRHRIAVMTPAGLKTTILQDLKSIAFTEKDVQDQLVKALGAIHANRVQDQRDVTLDLRGQGDRPVTLSYVTAAPVWKSAYRVVLPEGDGDKAYMQGWAILENTTAQDWDNVSITLQSGSPVTYRQSLYESYYLDRPFLPLRVMDRLMPDVDRGGIAMNESYSERAESMPPMPQAKARGRGAGGSLNSISIMASADMAVGAAAPVNMAQADAAITEDSIASIVFRFPTPITLAAGSSMMLPVVVRDIPAESVLLYQPDTHARHPLAAVSLFNDGDSDLPPGILTLFEDAAQGLRYAGDAELAVLPRNDTRYVTFALDSAVTIDRTSSGQQILGAFTASKGIIRQKSMQSETTIYAIKPAADGNADASKTLVIEHPRRPGWTLKKPEGPDGIDGDIEQTENTYRFKVTLKSPDPLTLRVTQERSDFEHIALASLHPDDFSSRINAAGATIDAKTRKALQGAIDLHKTVFDLNAQLGVLEQRRNDFTTEQARIRQNLQSIPSGSDLAKRYLNELNAQEDQLKSLETQRETLRRDQAAAQSKLDTYISTLEF